MKDSSSRISIYFLLFVIYMHFVPQISNPDSAGELNTILKHSSDAGKLIVVNDCPSHKLETIEIDIKNSRPYKDIGYYFLEETNRLGYWHRKVTCGGKYTFSPPMFGSQTFVDWANRINCKFTMFKNCYVSPISVIFTNKYEIKPVNETSHGNVYAFRQGPVVGYEPYVIACAISYVEVNYAHTIFDGIYPILLVPELYRKNAKILFPKMKDYQREFFVCLDLYDKVIEMKSNEYIFASRVIIPTHPRTHFVHFGPGLKAMSEYLRKKLNVTHIIPTKYKFMNRPIGASRRIPNGDELFEALKKEIPDIPWIKEDDSARGSIEFTAKTMAETLLMITVPGANSQKTIFRGPGTMIIFINTNGWDYGVYLPPASLGQKFIWFMNAKFSHYGKSTKINATRFIEACSVAVQYLKEGHWPKPKANAFIDFYEPNRYVKSPSVFPDVQCD